MSNPPRVSVIMSFLNASPFLAEAIGSVTGQTFRSWELLLIDDGSNDSSTVMARQYAARHPEVIRYFEHPNHCNRGQVASRNLGMEHAQGEYLANLDADDVWLPHKLEQQVAIMDSYPRVGMVFGATQFWRSWTGQASDLQSDYLVPPGVPGGQIYDPPALLEPFLTGEACLASLSNCLFRKEVITSLGGFDEAFTAVSGMYEDQAFLAKIYLNLPVYVSEACWDRYRLHPNSLCARVTRAGQHPAATVFYLKWVEHYLSRQGALKAERKAILHHRLWPYQHPHLAHWRDWGARLAGKLRRVGARLLRG